MAVVLPNSFLEDAPLREALLKVWRAVPLTYDADLGMRPLEFHGYVRNCAVLLPPAEADMNAPTELRLYGFANPLGRTPMFLVPLFGAPPEFWIQDGKSDGRVTRFFLALCLRRRLFNTAARIRSCVSVTS